MDTLPSYLDQTDAVRERFARIKAREAILEVRGLGKRYRSPQGETEAQAQALQEVGKLESVEAVSQARSDIMQARSPDQVREAVKSAMGMGRDALIAALRTKNLYPPGMYAGKIAEKVVELMGAKGKVSDELVFDDIEFLSREHEPAEAAKSYEGEPGEIDELLDVGLEDDKFEEGDEIKKIDTTLKIEDDEFSDIEDES